MSQKVIYKYKIDPPELNMVSTIQAPYYFKPLSVGIVDGELYVWGSTTPSGKIKDEYRKSVEHYHYFMIVPTGFECEIDDRDFLGTVFIEKLVFHVFYQGNNCNI